MSGRVPYIVAAALIAISLVRWGDLAYCADPGLSLSVTRSWSAGERIMYEAEIKSRVPVHVIEVAPACPCVSMRDCEGLPMRVTAARVCRIGVGYKPDGVSVPAISVKTETGYWAVLALAE